MNKKLFLGIVVFVLALCVVLAIVFLSKRPSENPKPANETPKETTKSSVFEDLNKPQEPEKPVEVVYPTLPENPDKTINQAATDMLAIVGSQVTSPAEYYARLTSLGYVRGRITDWEAPEKIKIRKYTESGTEKATDATVSCGTDTALFDSRTNITLLETGFSFFDRLSKNNEVFLKCTNAECTQFGGPCVINWVK